MSSEGLGRSADSQTLLIRAAWVILMLVPWSTFEEALRQHVPGDGFNYCECNRLKENIFKGK